STSRRSRDGSGEDDEFNEASLVGVSFETSYDAADQASRHTMLRLAQPV
ncbi:MAG: hypothetical protein H0U28_01085, partial [Nocardioidaceae bacterium]|nr:hypothetical protein [Nocardioidaceae bacterium]